MTYPRNLIVEQHAARRFTFPAVMLVLLVAFAMGGGGSRFGLANLGVQLTAIAALALHRQNLARFASESLRGVLVLVVATLMLPLLQLLPLPPSVWSALPGRELVARSLEMVGPAGWMSLSVNPLRTLLALSALITPLAVLVVGWSLPRSRLVDLGWLVAGLGIVTTLIGVAQLGATDPGMTIFGARDPGSIVLGTFANRNSTGLFLVFALTLAALLPAPRPHPALLFVRLAVCLLLVLTIVLTRSRTAIVLALLPAALGGIKAIWWGLNRRGNSGPRNRSVGIVLAALAAATVAMAALVITAPGPIGAVLERFEAKDDPRRYIWDDGTFAAARYWPAGAGIGTFDEVFQVDESLENLTQRQAGRAHNDFLELAIEAGFAGLALAAAWIVMLAWLSWRARLSQYRWAAWAGATFLLAIALQSITDYPLRNQTIMACAGFALLLLVRAGAEHRRVLR